MVRFIVVASAVVLGAWLALRDARGGDWGLEYEDWDVARGYGRPG